MNFFHLFSIFQATFASLYQHRLHLHSHTLTRNNVFFTNHQHLPKSGLVQARPTSKRSASSSLRAVVEPKENGSMDETVADAVQSAEKAFEMADATPAGEQAQAPRAMQAMMYVYSTFFHSLSFSCCSR